MKLTFHLFILLAFVLSSSSLVFAQKKGVTPNKSTAVKKSNTYKPNYLDSFSYAVGILEYSNFKKTNLKIILADFKLGLEDAANNRNNLTEEQATALLQRVMAARAQERIAQAKLQNTEYFKNLKTKPGIIEIKPGLYYEVIKEGVGPKPPSDTTQVKVNYIGTLIDGKEFDNSFKRGQPAVFPLNGVIKGWSEALKNMPVGSSWKIYLDSDWGYGDRGAGSAIPPGSPLVFQVDLLDIVQ